MLPAIFGFLGTSLSENERAFFKESNPAGYILFGRNIDDKENLRRLTDDLRALSGRDNVPILIDQEGGRVQRMTAPLWPKFPNGEIFDKLYDISPISAIEAARINAEALAHHLAAAGVSVNCLPLLDVRQEGAHDIIGDRALGREPQRVAALGQAVLDGMARAGVAGILKHIPGHGRSKSDSHLELPIVDASEEDLQHDMAPFKQLNQSAMAMTAHIVYTAWDKENCATLSPAIIQNIIRGQIGFDGWLMSDDLDMKALQGDIADLAKQAIEAGCDVALNCWGKMDDMTAMAEKLPDMTPQSLARLDRAMQGLSMQPRDEYDALIAKRDALLAMAA
ncbi:beta-hexosaminidase [Sphingorhabdus lutea]|uniref:beta-N-acetylhexosaminidase n=1 Tax=Sphingorhabdus lutea TaxID=1913578 RepID=A0A1L3JCV0_9SPHN|nr:beta-N-acetylhexosaminidase [Sphingorhabdus lutea]APG62987.1 beta-hexosaminidase [Sphingorhabdus lutea]